MKKVEYILFSFLVMFIFLTDANAAPIFDTPYLQIQIKSGFFMFCACVPIA